VRTVIVVQCKYGMEFVKQLYNGLNTPTNIKRIFVCPPDDGKETRITNDDIN
jgi:hypothetical protein